MRACRLATRAAAPQLGAVSLCPGLPHVACHPFFGRSPNVNFSLKSTFSISVEKFEKVQAKQNLSGAPHTLCSGRCLEGK